MLRRIALFPASRRGKWVMVAAWLVIAGFAGPIGGKLSSVVKNDQASYLPGNAESTQVLTDVGDGVWWPGRLSRRQGPPAMPETLVVRSATDSLVGPRARS